MIPKSDKETQKQIEQNWDDYCEKAADNVESRELFEWVKAVLVPKFNEAKEGFPKIGFHEEFIRGFEQAFKMSAFIATALSQKPIPQSSLTPKSIRDSE